MAEDRYQPSNGDESPREQLAEQMTGAYRSISPEWDAFVRELHEAVVDERSDEEVDAMLRGRAPIANTRGGAIYINCF